MRSAAAISGRQASVPPHSELGQTGARSVATQTPVTIAAQTEPTQSSTESSITHTAVTGTVRAESDKTRTDMTQIAVTAAIIPGPDPEPMDGGRGATTGGVLSSRSREELSTFISTSVLPLTAMTYTRKWEAWAEFVKSETGSLDPYLTGMREDDKSALVGLMMLREHQGGKRGKGATSFTAAVRHRFARAMHSTTFLDSAIITTARTSCLMKPAELRAKKDRGPAESVKLPICEEILTDMRTRLWVAGDWSDEAKRSKATYVGCMYGFEFTGRVGEYTHSERNQIDHCARMDDFTFTVRSDEGDKNVLASGLAALKLEDSVPGRSGVLECWVRTVTSKGKVVVKPKVLCRRSPEEATYLDDITAWVSHSGAVGTDEVFSFRRADGTLAVLSGRTIRDELKRTCAAHGLPPSYFSSHSLRKGGISHMRAQGTTEEDRRDRGNYSAGSQVMNNTYDYATGLGPLASNGLEGGHRLSKADLRRLIPPEKKTA